MERLTTSWERAGSCDESMVWLEGRLSSAGLRFLRTFDLHDARLAAGDCLCPHHGTSICDCQMVVVLVYAGEGLPVALVVHGNDGMSWISVIDRPEQRPAPASISALQRALSPAPASKA